MFSFLWLVHKNGQHAGSINKNLALLVCKKTSRYRKAEKKKQLQVNNSWYLTFNKTTQKQSSMKRYNRFTHIGCHVLWHCCQKPMSIKQLTKMIVCLSYCVLSFSLALSCTASNLPRWGLWECSCSACKSLLLDEYWWAVLPLSPH